ncbi:MAG: sigma-54 dependent transcriptional regulator [Bacteroidales bacterium]|jgi:DNA-binding NtrC family response regulator|nr:sigma-54 dependent transcriptional regulator [Bacteroidales bacterium]
MKELSILVLDDEVRMRDEIEEFLSGQEYLIHKAEVPSQAFRILEKNHVDILILDVKLPEMDGLEVLEKVRKMYPEMEVIMISGHGDMNTVIEAMRHGAFDYFRKPFRLAEISHAIERTRKFILLNEKLKSTEHKYDLLSNEIQNVFGHELITESAAMKKVVELMGRVAMTDFTSVLITGESGTGKELVARGIHFLSNRKKQLFYSVNCSAVPESLFESEFFGHKKGAFTDAREDKEGWFEISDKGTLFLDEIGDMPMNQQAKLLRVLEEKKVSKIGSRVEIPVDVRVITASNRNLFEMSKKRKFRPDLYHRLSTFVIEIPPLRERRDDIPPLLEYYIHHFAEQMKKPIKTIEAKLIEHMTAYDFPGNVRELRNMVERAVILCDTKSIGWDNFRYNVPGMEQATDSIVVGDKLDLAEIEKATILKALDKAGGNKTKAAELLNITWQALDRRMEKYGIK